MLNAWDEIILEREALDGKFPSGRFFYVRITILSLTNSHSLTYNGTLLHFQGFPHQNKNKLSKVNAFKSLYAKDFCCFLWFHFSNSKEEEV